MTVSNFTSKAFLYQDLCRGHIVPPGVWSDKNTPGQIGLSNLKKEIEDMSEEEKEVEKPNEIIGIVEKIIESNDLNRRGKGLKTSTPDQMLSRLSII